jgi:tetratricopeptide (TPR) repeat protein
MRAVLDELLNDPDFQAPDRHKRFLRYIVEETLAGRASRIKAYSVAVDVFGRPADFDSAIDSIVRTEATRLRAILSKYYENRAVPVQIRIPKGTYVPEFVETQQSSDVDEIHTHNLSGNDAPGCSATESKQASIDLAQVMDFRQPMLFVEQVEALTDDYATRVLARTLSQELLATLGQFEGVTLFRRPDGPMMSSLFAGVAARSIYLLATKVRIVCDKVYLWWHLSDPRSMEVISTATQWVALQSGSDVLIETAIAQRIALAIGGRRGLIKSLQVRLFLGTPTPGYASVLMAERSDSVDDTPERRAAIVEALEKTVEIDPEYASAWAYLAIMYCDRIRNSFQGFHEHRETMAKAMNAVQRANYLAPHSATTNFATAITRRQLGDARACVAATYRAIEASPLDPKILRFMGSRFWEIGRYEEGVALTRRAIAIKEHREPLDGLVMGFESYRVGDYKDAIAHFYEASDLGVPLALAGLVASFGQFGEREAAGPYVERLLTLRPNYAHEMRDYFRNRNPNDQFIDYLADGLRKAGIPVADAHRGLIS